MGKSPDAIQIEHLVGNPCHLLIKAGAQPASPWQPRVRGAPHALETVAPPRVCSSDSILPGGRQALTLQGQSAETICRLRWVVTARRGLLGGQGTGSSQGRWLWLGGLWQVVSQLHPAGAQVAGMASTCGPTVGKGNRRTGGLSPNKAEEHSLQAALSSPQVPGT